MSRELDAPLLQAILAGWDRHNRVLINLAGAIPEGGFAARALPGSPSVGEMFTHMHHERMVSVAEEAPEHGGEMPEGEWVEVVGAGEISGMLEESGRVVRGAVEGRVAAGRPLDLHFAHPVVLIQFLIFHEGYHHGQIKLALKAAGLPLSDEAAGPLTWDVWRGREPLQRME
jgi:hypothetical protein